MKKVLFVATVVQMHIMKFHVPYLKMLKDMGVETAVAANNDYENPADLNIPYCDTYYNLPFARSPFARQNVLAYRELKKIIREGEWDLIHCHTPVGAIAARFAARAMRKKGVKVLYTAHGFHFYQGAPRKNWLFFYPIEKLCARWTDGIITINHEDCDLTSRKFKPKAVYYVPGVGVDTEKFVPGGKDKRPDLRAQLQIPQDAKVLLSVGEFNENKNQQVVIRALPMLKDPNVYYVMCGEHSSQQVRELARSLGVEDRVRMPGFCSNMVDYFQMADIYLQPSLREGLPVAQMEAMACALPVVCSRIRGCVDLVVDREEGRLMENDVQMYADVLNELLEQDDVREQMGKKAREHVLLRDIRKVRGTMQDIYQSMLDM